jgi:hypothetical protein
MPCFVFAGNAARNSAEYLYMTAVVTLLLCNLR